MSKKKYNIIFLALLISAAGLYFAARDYSYVGYYNDDAFYVYAARYFAGLEHPPEGKLNLSRPIGYPLMLTPFARLFPQDRSEVFKFLSLLMILAVPVLFFYFLQDIFRHKDTMLLFAALLFFNPNMVRMSGYVLSETPFLLFSIIFIIALKKYLNFEKNKGSISLPYILLLAFLAAVIFYLRPQGIALFAGFAVWLFYTKRYRAAIYFIFFCLLFISPQLIFSPGGSFLDKYAWEIGNTYSFAGLGELFVGNIKYYIENIYRVLILGIAHLDSNSFIVRTGISFTVFLFISTYIVFKPPPRELPGYMKFVKIYILFFLLIHIFWINQSVRYMLPVFIFIIYFLLKSMEKSRVLKYLLAGALLAGFVVSDIKVVATSLEKDRSEIIYPRETFSWVKENTSQDAVFLVNSVYRFMINTSRRAVLIGHYSRDESYIFAHKYDADYVVYFTAALMQGSAGYNEQYVRSKRVEMYLRDKGRYKPLYRNPREQTAIFKIIKNEDFPEAWEAYQEGIRYFNLNNINKAKEKYRQALEFHPDFTLASLELAAIYFSRGEDKKANRVINRALKQYQKDPRLWALKGSIYARNDMEKLARRYFDTAQELAEFFKDRPLIRDIKKNRERYNLTK